MKLTRIVVLPALLLAGIIPAQDLVGFTAQVDSNLTRQRICQPPGTVCPNALPAPGQPWAGGAVYSPFEPSIWHTNGTRLQSNRVADCKILCNVAATLALGPGSLASGLTLDPFREQLHQLETTQGFGARVTYRLGVTCPARVSACKFLLPSTLHYATAIALDRKHDRILVGTSRFIPDPQNRILVMKRDDPGCRVPCQLAAPKCGAAALGPIRAMAYDEATDQLFVSDGRQTAVYRVDWTLACPTLIPVKCCSLNHPKGEFWVGFDVPSGSATSISKSCTDPNFPSSPGLLLTTNGDAAAGYKAFKFKVYFAPAGTVGLLLWLFDTRRPPLPFSCGRVYPFPWHVSFAMVMQGGDKDEVPVPIPNSLWTTTPTTAQTVLFDLGKRTPGIALTNALIVPVGG